MQLVGLDPTIYRDRYPSQLSGGQQQRVGVARALAADPPVLLMDEPFGAIDPVTRGRLQQEFLGLQRRLRKTVVLVTHDIDEAVLLGDRIALLAQGGVLAQHGTPDDLLTRPADDFVADFVGHDRGLKRLAVTKIDESWLEPAGTNGDSAGLPQVARTATLREALAKALLSEQGVIVVVDESGEPVGRVGPRPVGGGGEARGRLSGAAGRRRRHLGGDRRHPRPVGEGRGAGRAAGPAWSPTRSSQWWASCRARCARAASASAGRRWRRSSATPSAAAVAHRGRRGRHPRRAGHDRRARGRPSAGPACCARCSSRRRRRRVASSAGCSPASCARARSRG